MTNRSSSPPRNADAVQGNTVPAQGETQDRVPRTPNERDESADSQGAQEASAQRVGRQAQQDVERGLVDTGKGPELDAAYDKVRDGASATVKKPAR